MVACKIQIQKWADLYESKGKYLYKQRFPGVIAYLEEWASIQEITVYRIGIIYFETQRFIYPLFLERNQSE